MLTGKKPVGSAFTQPPSVGADAWSMSTTTASLIQTLSALLLIAWTVLSPRIGEAEAFRFTAQELEHQEANWTPQDVEIHRGHDVEDGFRFVLDNPTTRTHAFEAPGVLEQLEAENREFTTRPLRITVAPGETVEVHVRFTQIERDPETPCADGAACYRFYCPLHRGDNDPGGLIRVRP